MSVSSSLLAEQSLQSTGSLMLKLCLRTLLRLLEGLLLLLLGHDDLLFAYLSLKSPRELLWLALLDLQSRYALRSLPAL